MEVMTYGTVNRADERWLQRTLSQVSTQLTSVRSRIFTFAQLQRHHLVLDLNAATGLLTWEAIRQVPEGGVYACVRNRSDADALVELSAALPETMQPIIFTASVAQIPAMLASLAPNVQFDSIIGRNVLASELDKGLAAQILAQLLPHSVKLILSETVPRHTQRFYRLLPSQNFDAQLYERLVLAEEAIYTDASDPMLNWDADDLRHAFASSGHYVQVVVEQYLTPLYISDNFIKRLFTANPNRPSYADRLAANLTSEEINIIKNLFVRYLLNQSVNWSSTVAFFNISG